MKSQRFGDAKGCAWIELYADGSTQHHGEYDPSAAAKAAAKGRKEMILSFDGGSARVTKAGIVLAGNYAPNHVALNFLEAILSELSK